MPYEMDGFAGFTELLTLPTGAVPQTGGVYVIVRPGIHAPQFLAASPAGRNKGRDPSLPVGELEAAWVPDEPVVYIGKATNLRTRLSQYRRHGRGTTAPHWGGRMIWQLADHAELQVGWRECGEPRAEERRLIAEFRAMHGTWPFANRTS